MAPSGKFWIAIPRASANAPPAVISAEPAMSPAYTIPTAIPSGILCRVTAKTIMVVRGSPLLGPSAFSSFMCKWGIRVSKSNRNKIPIQNPITAGTNAHLPIALVCSIAGIIRLQTDAATITPAANPVKALWTAVLKFLFMKKTQPAPAEVPINGINSPHTTFRLISCQTTFSFRTVQIP